MSAAIPEVFLSFLEAPTVGFLGTVRPDGVVQVNPMWFVLEHGTVRFTHTTKRAKFRNLQQNPAMTLAVPAPGNPYSYVELRGRLAEVVPDPEGAFFVTLATRYGQPDPQPPADSADRVVLVMAVEQVSGQ